MLLAVGLEFFGVVTIVAIENQQSVYTFRTRYYMEIEVPNPIHTFLISSPAIIGYYNTPGSRKVTLLILVSKIILPSQDNK